MEFHEMNLQWKEIPYQAQSIETLEFGILSQKDVTQTLKEIMKAEPPKHKSSASGLVFSQNVLDRMKEIYDIDVDIKVNIEAHEALSGNVEDSFNQNYNTENGYNRKNCQDNDTEFGEKEATDTYSHSYNVPQAP